MNPNGDPLPGLRRRRAGALLALFAMLLQIGIGAFFAPAFAARQQDERVFADGSRILLICTPRGLKRVAIDPDGRVRDLPDDAAGDLECPLNMLTAAGSLAPPSIAQATDPRYRVLRTAPLYKAELCLPVGDVRRPPGRAPPA